MYFLNTLTFKLHRFNSENEVEYAILSHRWGDEEILFCDMQDFASCKKAGAQKIRSFCRLLQQHSYRETPKFEWCWIDTCCIDKDSSAELSEAINSMYRWYEKSTLCVAFLSDVDAQLIDQDFEDQLASSCWFTRCWTLQELIAPRNLHFCNANWLDIGSQRLLLSTLSDITKIPENALSGRDLDDFSIAQRMSWAANRQATRKEDEAYSLMGIFNINMPMLYGEGDRAFERLQEEIIRRSDDHTIFAWQRLPPGALSSGLLALSPSQFDGCSDIESACFPFATNYKKPAKDNFVLTNQGLTADLPLGGMWWHTYVAYLNAVIRRRGQADKWVGVILQRLQTMDEYRRCAIRREFKYGEVHNISYTEDAGDDVKFTEWRQITVDHRRKREALYGRFPCGFDMKSTIFSQRLASFPNRYPTNLADILAYHYVLPAPFCEERRNIVQGSVVISRNDGIHFGPICNIHLSNFSMGIKLCQFGLSSDLEPICILVPTGYQPSKPEQPQDIPTWPSYDDIRSFKVDYARLAPSPLREESINFHVLHHSHESSPLLVIRGNLTNYQRYRVMHDSETCDSSCHRSVRGLGLLFKKSAHRTCDYWTLEFLDIKSAHEVVGPIEPQDDDLYMVEFLEYFKVQTQIRALIEIESSVRSRGRSPWRKEVAS